MEIREGAREDEVVDGDLTKVRARLGVEVVEGRTLMVSALAV